MQQEHKWSGIVPLKFARENTKIRAVQEMCSLILYHLLVSSCTEVPNGFVKACSHRLVGDNYESSGVSWPTHRQGLPARTAAAETAKAAGRRDQWYRGVVYLLL